MKLRYKVLGLILAIIMITTSVITYADMSYGGIDYVEPNGSAVVGFNTNIWKNNLVISKTQFPLVEAWKEPYGNILGQPLIVDDVVFAISDNAKLNVIDIATGKSIASVSLAQKDKYTANGNMFLIKKAKGENQLIIPLRDGLITSKTVKVTYSNNKPVSATIANTWSEEFDISTLNDQNVKTSKIITKDMNILKDKTLEKSYIGFGTYSGHIIVLDVDTGKPITNGNVEVTGTIGSSGIVYRNFETIVLPKNMDTAGELVGGAVVNGIFMLNDYGYTLLHDEGLISPTVYKVIKHPVKNKKIGMLILQDKTGDIIGYDTTDQETMFIIDKYRGNQTVDGFTIIEKYVLVTLTSKKDKSASVLCLDYNNAIIEGLNNEDMTANDSILFEEKTNAISYSGTLAISVAERENLDNGNIKETVYNQVFLTADKGEKDSLKMFYMDQYNASTKRAIPVPYGFGVKSGENIVTKSSIDIEGGITTPLSFACNHLVFGDGKGNLIAYTPIEENNLAVVNMRNTAEELTRGETYIATVDIINATGKHQQQIPIELIINDQVAHSGLIDIPTEGITVNFQYTVPKEYNKDEVTLKVEVNLKEPHVLDEITYKDNDSKMTLKVSEAAIDLEAKNIQQSTPVAADTYNTAKVDIINHSDYDQDNVLIYYKLNGKKIFEERISIKAKESIEREFSWKAPNFDTNAILSVVVDPEREINDNNRENNTTTKTVKIEKSKSVFLNCKDGGTFSRSYSWVYDTVWVCTGRNKKGECTSGYWLDLWTSETVKYSEKLTITTEVNTGQQYKDTSRGGWEIVPKFGPTEAKKTTRSGYGIELKVTATYSTTPTWETIPSGYRSATKRIPASPYGEDNIRGLNNAIAIAHLPNGQVVQMERIASQSNKYSVTWQLPEIYYTPKGLNETWKGRYFAMDPKTPDGKYDFYVEILNVGESNMHCTAEDYIRIYGDVWRDTNIQRNRK